MMLSCDAFSRLTELLINNSVKKNALYSQQQSFVTLKSSGSWHFGFTYSSAHMLPTSSHRYTVF